MNDIFSIKGKVAIITGASGVLGGSLAKHFVKEGAQVIVLGRSIEKLKNIVSDLESLGGDVLALEANVMDIKSLEN